MIEPGQNWPEQLSAEREQIAVTLYRNVPTRARSVIVKLLTQSFVDEYVGAILDDRPPALREWIERMSSRPGRASAVASLIDAAAPLQTYFSERGLPERYLDVLRELSPVVHTEAEHEMEEGAHPYADHLDEVDSAISKVLQNLAEVNPHAAEHARGVSAWCTKLARRLAFSEKETTFVTRCGLLHDIGELTVDAATPPGPEHIVAGERIVRENIHLVHFAPIIRAHHEALDGTGYPAGLREEQIPMAARIVSVADEFNSLITGEGGRKPLTDKASLAEITHACGTRFDVTVVAALHALVNSR